MKMPIEKGTILGTHLHSVVRLPSTCHQLAISMLINLNWHFLDLCNIFRDFFTVSLNLY